MAKMIHFKRLEDFQAGGFFPEGDYIIAKARVVVTDMDGNWETPSAVLRIHAKPFDVKKNKVIGKEEFMTVYSMGPAEHFVAVNEKGKEVADGKEGVTVGVRDDSPRNGLSKNCNFFLFANAMFQTSMDEKNFDDRDMRTLEGLVFTFANKPKPQRSGGNKLEESAEGEGEGREKTIALPVEFHEKKGGKKLIGEVIGDTTVGKKKDKAKDDEDDEDEDSDDSESEETSDDEEEDEEESSDDEDSDDEDSDSDEDEDEDEESEDKSGLFKEAVAELLARNKKGLERAKAKVEIFNKGKAKKDADVANMVSDDDALKTALKGTGFRLSKDGKKIEPAAAKK